MLPVKERNMDFYYSSQPEKILDLFDEVEPAFIKSDQFNSSIMITCVSTPASYYHLLKRQARCSKRKPLIIYVPYKFDFPAEGYSKLEDLASDSCFQPVIIENDIIDKLDLKDIILCSGKVYFDLVSERSKRNLENRITIARLEQLYPFPYKTLTEFLSSYPNTKIWWAQEEQYNDGWWSFVENKLATEHINIKYAGRYHVTPLKYCSTKMSEDQLSYVFESILEEQ